MKVVLNKLFLFSLLSTFIFGCYSAADAQSARMQNENPSEILVSYYDAINDGQYRRAYNYWKNPTQSYRDFVRGYNSTRKVRLLMNSNIPVEGAAGSLYKEVPTVLISTMKNGSRQIFYGCYTLRKINLRPPDIPKEDIWHIDKGDLKSAPVNSDTSKLLAEGCGKTPEIPADGDNLTSRVPGFLGSDLQSARQSVSIPASIQKNRDFEITVTTSGNGCVSAADTSVISGENSADVFVYDFTSANRPGIFCTMIYKSLPHKTTLRFSKSGEAVIRVWGRQQSGNSPFGEPIVVEKRVSVR